VLANAGWAWLTLNPAVERDQREQQAAANPPKASGDTVAAAGLQLVFGREGLEKIVPM